VLAPGVTASSSTSGSICNCEFDCKDANGLQVDVVVKVKMYCDQIRSGSFQKEMEEVNMTLAEFKVHFLKCMRKYA
jgi:hypothetical protein